MEMLHFTIDEVHNCNLVQQPLLLHHSSCYTCYQGQTIRSPDPKMGTSNHAATSGPFY